jgi:tetratricopeptide (TPR) repeat protein
MRISATWLSLVVAVCLAAPGALADPQGKEVDELVQRGNQHFQQQEFEQAAELLKKAYAIEPRPIFLFNIAQALRRAGKAKEALAMYQRFLETDPNTRLRAETEGYSKELMVLIEEQQRAEGIRESLIEERQRAERQQEALLAERRRAEQNRQALSTEQRRAEGIRKELLLERKLAEKERRRPLYRRAWFWGVLGAGAAALAVSVGVGVALRPQDPVTDGGIQPLPQ